MGPDLGDSPVLPNQTRAATSKKVVISAGPAAENVGATLRFRVLWVLSPRCGFCFVLFSESVAQKAHGPLLLSHNLICLSFLLCYLRGKTLTRGVQMCDTFYCKSGQTSQISGKFCGGLKAALGSKTLRNQKASLLLFIWMKKFKIGSSFFLIKGLTAWGFGRNRLGMLEYFICRFCTHWRAELDDPQRALSN